MTAAFDESLFSGFRHSLYPEYKANRALPDAALAYQLACCRQLTGALGITCLADPVYEADDLLVWAALTGRQQGLSCHFVTRDKDLAQAIEPGDQWVDWNNSSQALDYEALCVQWGGKPQKLVDVLALAGDPVDNIPGIQGIGLKTALSIMQNFDSLDDLYENVERVAALPLRGASRIMQKLVAHYEQAFLFRELIRLRPPECVLAGNALTVSPVSQSEFIAVIQQLALGPQFERLAIKLWW